MFSSAKTPFSFSGRINADPLVQNGRQILMVDAVGTSVPSRGILRVVVSLFPSYRIDQHIEGRCVSFKDASESRFAPVCLFSTITEKKSERISFRARLSDIRNFFSDAIRSGLPRPQADLLSGLLVGAHGAFSSDLAGAFRISGLSHIVAVSGSNISLMIAGVWSVFSRSRLGRKKIFWFMAGGVALFVLFTGASSATIRAGIMGMLVLCAQYLGRLSKGSTALLATAALMVFLDPRILLFNIGFQLSCLATLGLMLCSPPIASRLLWIPSKGGLRDIVAQTASAILFTAPLLLVTFQTFSPVSFFANILVVPVVPAIMAVGFGWSMLAVASYGLQTAGFFSFQPLIAALALPVYGFLSYIIHAARFFSSVPFATVRADVGPWAPLFLIVSYAALTVWTWRLRASAKP